MAVSKTETYEFTTTGEPRLIVRNAAGSVTVRPGHDGQVQVMVTKKARGGLFGSASEADLERVTVHVTQESNAIRIESKYDNLRGGLKNVTVDVEITAPTASSLDAQLNAGNLHLSGLSGSLTAVVNAGNVDAEDVVLRGNCDVSLNAGNLELAGALAAGASLNARINAGGARLSFPHDTPAQLEATANVGTVTVTGWSVNTVHNLVQQKASGALGAEPTGLVRVRVDAGNITLIAR